MNHARIEKQAVDAVLSAYGLKLAAAPPLPRTAYQQLAHGAARVAAPAQQAARQAVSPAQMLAKGHVQMHAPAAAAAASPARTPTVPNRNAVTAPARGGRGAAPLGGPKPPTAHPDKGLGGHTFVAPGEGGIPIGTRKPETVALTPGRAISNQGQRELLSRAWHSTTPWEAGIAQRAQPQIAAATAYGRSIPKPIEGYMPYKVAALRKQAQDRALAFFGLLLPVEANAA